MRTRPLLLSALLACSIAPCLVAQTTPPPAPADATPTPPAAAPMPAPAPAPAAAPATTTTTTTTTTAAPAAPADTTAAPAAAPAAPAAATPVSTDATATPPPAPDITIKDTDAHPGVATKSKDSSGKDTLSVDFPDEDVRTILRNVADLFELNIIIPETLQGKTTIKLRDVTWRQIFQNVLSPVGYTYVEDGNIIKIISNDSLLQEPTTTEVFILNYAKASDVLPTLSALVDAGSGGKIVVDSRSNSLVLTERPSRMTRIRTILEQLDRATDQVMIETKFIEVTEGDTHNLGVNWSALQSYKLGVQPAASVTTTGGQTTSNGSSASSSPTTTGTNTATSGQTLSSTNATTNGVTTSTTSAGLTSSLANTLTNGTSTALDLLEFHHEYRQHRPHRRRGVHRRPIRSGPQCAHGAQHDQGRLQPDRRHAEQHRGDDQRG